MSMPEDHRLGKMIWEMPVNMRLERLAGGVWRAIYEPPYSSTARVYGEMGPTPELALERCRQAMQAEMSRDLWLEEAEQRGEA